MPLMVSRTPWAKLPVSARCLPPFVEVAPGVNRLPLLRSPESFAAVASLPLLEAAAPVSAAPDFSSTDGVLAFDVGNAFSTGVVSVNDWQPHWGAPSTASATACGVIAAAIASRRLCSPGTRPMSGANRPSQSCSSRHASLSDDGVQRDLGITGPRRLDESVQGVSDRRPRKGDRGECPQAGKKRSSRDGRDDRLQIIQRSRCDGKQFRCVSQRLLEYLAGGRRALPDSPDFGPQSLVGQE